MKRASIFVLLTGILIATGCSASRHQVRANSSDFHLIQEVPFYPDSTDQCGPSTLAAVLTYWKRPTTAAELKKEIYLPKLKGSLPMDLLPAVEARGLKGRIYSGTLEDLRAQISKGRPLLAYIDLGYSFWPVGHYVVVTGFDDHRNGIYMNSGKTRNRFVSYKRFLQSWCKTDCWTLRVLPPSGELSARRPE